MVSFLFFDGDRCKFRKVESLVQLIKLHPTIIEDPVVNDFLSGEHKINLEKPETTFITNFNEVVKCLDKGAKDVSNTVLYTLKMIFKMDCYKVNGLPVILFWTNIQSIFDNGQLMVKRLNVLLRSKKFFKPTYPLSLLLFSISLAFGSLADSCTQFIQGGSSDNQKQDEDERIPLNDDQKQKFKKYYEHLQIILENICNNLSGICKNFRDNTLRDKFKANFDDLQKHLEKYTQIMDPIIIDLEAKMQKFQKEKKIRLIKSGVSVLSTCASIGLAYYLPAGRVILKGASYAVGAASGSYAVYNGYKFYKLRNIINEHKQVRDVINDAQKSYVRIREYLVIFDPDDLNDRSQPTIIINQFKELRDDVKKMRSTLPSIFQ